MKGGGLDKKLHRILSCHSHFDNDNCLFTIYPAAASYIYKFMDRLFSFVLYSTKRVAERA